MTSQTPATTRPQASELFEIAQRPVLRRKQPGQLVAMVVLALLIGWAIATLITSRAFDWPVVWQYLFDQRILSGIGVTLKLTVIAEVIGFVAGLVLAVMRMSHNPLITGVAGAYIWFFRGTPLLVQLLFWGFAAAVFPMITLGIPYTDLHIASWSTNSLISLMTAAILGLGLNEAAYTAEIIRAGLLSVPAGQSEASRALGLSGRRTLWSVVIPQAMPVIIPPVGNNVISMLKTTSLVVVLGVGDLLYNTQQIYAQNLRQIPLLIVASLWYILFTTVLTFGQSRLERRFARGLRRTTGRKVR